jgi:hypothetical protein
LRSLKLLEVANFKFLQIVRPVCCSSIIPWSACAAPGLSTLPSPGA